MVFFDRFKRKKGLAVTPADTISAPAQSAATQNGNENKKEVTTVSNYKL